MTFELCTLCYNYQRRWIWQLSSLVQQNYIPEDICISVGAIGDNGKPSTNEVIENFQGLHIKLIDYKSFDNFPVRGYIRDEQIKQSSADWLIFIDPDHILHPDFFKDVEAGIKKYGHLQRVFSIYEKVTTHKVVTQYMIDNQSDIYIKDAYRESLNIRKAEQQIQRRVAGGCLQIVNRKSILELNDGKYTVEGKSRDRHLFKQKTPDDARFRRVLGGSCFFKGSNPLVHLNHYRVTDKQYNPESQK